MNHQVNRNYLTTRVIPTKKPIEERLEKDEDHYLKNLFDNNLLFCDNVLKKDNEVTIRGGALFCDHHTTKNGHRQHTEFVDH